MVAVVGASVILPGAFRYRDYWLPPDRTMYVEPAQVLADLAAAQQSDSGAPRAGARQVYGLLRTAIRASPEAKFIRNSQADGMFTAVGSEPNKKVVVIDDDPSVQEVVRAYLERDGYHVFVSGNASDGVDLAARLKPGLIVLDLMLPDRPGEEIAREIRERSDVPILMLTAKASEDERVGGLALGADDYLTKPFSPRELVARVRAILRRSRGASEPLVAVMRFDDGALEIDTVQHEVRRDGEPVELTPNEYKLLTTLARYPGRAYSRFELINHVQGYDYDGYERTIDAHVKNLRKKIEADPKHPRYVETVFGLGYRLAKR